MPTGLPQSPESLAATVRIRVKFEENESVGTGTIIDLTGDEALVLTVSCHIRGIPEHIQSCV